MLIIFLIFINSTVKSQNLPKDSVYGNVKKIREKVIFLTEKENHQFLYHDDYGHSGFMGPESTISRFYNTWYKSDICYYLNYERNYNKKRKVIKDIWYGKKNNLLNSYRFLYDEKDRLISEIDSSEYSTSTRNHYFEEYGDGNVDENIIYESLKHNSFLHIYKNHKKGKVIRTKNYNENGTINEYINNYNDKGKLTYRIYKDPNNWSHDVQDSITVIYKSLINEYDLKNKLVKSQIFDLDKYKKKVVLSSQTINSYDEGNLISTRTSNKNGFETFYYYKYDNSNRLIEQYCCDKDISNAKIIQKYRYKNNLIDQLSYSEESFPSQEMESHKISYSYKYDDNKNWIEIIKTVNDLEQYKWVRELEYY